MAIPFNDPPAATVDHDTMYKLLLLEEKLRGHPHLAATRALVDASLVKADEANKAAAAKMMADRKAKADADAARAAHEAQVLADAEAARRRLAEAEAAKVTPAADQKTVAEAEAIAKAREAEAMRQHKEAFPAPAHVPPQPPLPPHIVPRSE